MAVPSEYEPLVRKFRRFIKDEAAKNDLLEAEENTDQFLYDCIVDALEEINWMFQPVTELTVADIGGDMPWVIVRMGATLQYLTGAGIHSARNAFNYSDGSGIQVSDTDTWGRYINYYNVLVNKHKEAVSNFKLKKNLDDVYGGVRSEYDDIS